MDLREGYLDFWGMMVQVAGTVVTDNWFLLWTVPATCGKV